LFIIHKNDSLRYGTITITTTAATTTGAATTTITTSQ
jgi:hypothetical protein